MASGTGRPSLFEAGPPDATSDRRHHSGKFVLRVEPTMRRRLVLKALAEGESLNSYCVKTLAKA